MLNGELDRVPAGDLDARVAEDVRLSSALLVLFLVGDRLLDADVVRLALFSPVAVVPGLPDQPGLPEPVGKELAAGVELG